MLDVKNTFKPAYSTCVSTYANPLPFSPFTMPPEVLHGSPTETLIASRSKKSCAQDYRKPSEAPSKHRLLMREQRSLLYTKSNNCFGCNFASRFGAMTMEMRFCLILVECGLYARKDLFPSFSNSHCCCHKMCLNLRNVPRPCQTFLHSAPERRWKEKETA